MSTRRQIQAWVSKRLAILVAVGVASLAVVLWQALIEREHAQIQFAVEQQAIMLQTEIIERIETKIFALERMARRWELRGGTPREEWEADAALYLTHQTGLRRITWVDSSYIAGWTVPELLASYRGVNRASEERRRVALEAAREMREARVTFADNLLGNNKGFLVFVPLFVGERFDGYIQGIIRTEDLFGPLLAEHDSLGYTILLFDGEEEIVKVFEGNRQDYPEWLQETEIELRNATLRIQVWPGPELVAKMRSSLPELALAAGLLLALLMLLTLRLAQRAKFREQEVGLANRELEEEITERKQAEEALRKSQVNLAEAQRIAHIGSWMRDLETDAGYYSEEHGRIFARTPEELHTHEQFLQSVHPEDRETVRRNVADALSTGKPYDEFYRIVLPDGAERIIHSRAETALDETGKPIRLVGTTQDITELKQAEIALRFTQFASDHSPIATYWMDSDARYIYVNEAACRSSGYSREELLSMSVPDINPDYSMEIWHEIWKKRKEWSSPTFEARHRTKDGRIVPVEITAYYLAFQGKEYNCSLVQDITERKRAEETLRQKEEQLRETQKMEAVGTLAGGVAHEFNNLLTGILGYSELLLKKRGGDPFLSKQIAEIKKAGEQAASLTSQLLAFSRKQVLQPRVLDLNEIVTEMKETLRGLMGEDIVIMTSLSPDLGRTKADAAQIKQIILNLASNARSAMPRGGKFILATENAELSEDDESGIASAPAARHVLLTVSDTGAGMDAETLSHVFEPFFTTKEVGKGTGLGLATVYGIVKQSGGRIKVSSELGRGTKFQIYLPRVDKAVSPPKRATARKQRSGSAKTVLLVEDAIQVRRMVCLFLQRAGYTVLEASNGVEALQVAQQSRQPIHMLLTDVIMPEMNGPDLAARLTEDLTDIKVLYMSGYSNHPVVQESVLKSGAFFIAKPFAPDALLQKVLDVFDTSAKVSSK